MLLQLYRKKQTESYTLGELFINNEKMCLTLEDAVRENKIKDKTAIPFGIYTINFRKEGKLHNQYLKKYGKKHYGMLEIENVPNFKYILIHTGNTVEDTSGCILVGNSFNEENQFLTGSSTTYETIYPIISNALLKNEMVTIEIINYKE